MSNENEGLIQIEEEQPEGKTQLPPKTKRVMSEKQLANLALGRKKRVDNSKQISIEKTKKAPLEEPPVKPKSKPKQKVVYVESESDGDSEPEPDIIYKKRPKPKEEPPTPQSTPARLRRV